MSISAYLTTIYGPKYENRQWISRKNRELEEMSKGGNIVNWIKGQDLQVLGVRRWRELVADRKKWKDIVRQAKAHSGL